METASHSFFLVYTGEKVMRHSGLKRSLLSIVPDGQEAADTRPRRHTPFKRLFDGGNKNTETSNSARQTDDLGIRRVTAQSLRPATSISQPLAPERKRSILTVREVLGVSRA